MGFVPNLHSEKESLRFRTDLPTLKKFRNRCTEFIFGLAGLHETFKILSLNTGSIQNLFLYSVGQLKLEYAC